MSAFGWTNGVASCGPTIPRRLAIATAGPAGRSISFAFSSAALHPFEQADTTRRRSLGFLWFLPCLRGRCGIVAIVGHVVSISDALHGDDSLHLAASFATIVFVALQSSRICASLLFNLGGRPTRPPFFVHRGFRSASSLSLTSEAT